MKKYADLNGKEVELIRVVGGWTTYLAADGSSRKDRNSKFTNHRDQSNDDIAQFTIQGEGSADSKLVAAKSVTAAIAEQAPMAATDTQLAVEDKNHPDSYNKQSGTWVCGECQEEFLSADSLAEHKAEHEPVAAPRPGSLAASLLSRDKAKEVSIELCQKSATKAVKAPREVKEHPLRTRKCPDCGAGTTHGTNDDGVDFNSCDECDWEYSVANTKPKLEPKLDKYVVGKSRTASGRLTIDRDDYVANILRDRSLDDIYAYVVLVMEALDIQFIGTGSRKMETGLGDFKSRYGHLNPGMQRMNLGNILRGVMNRHGISTLPEMK